jgi:hypothetical protein
MALSELVDASVPAGVSVPPDNSKITLRGTSSSGHQSWSISLQVGPCPDLSMIPIRPLTESFVLRSAEAERPPRR